MRVVGCNMDMSGGGGMEQEHEWGWWDGAWT